MGSIQVVNIKFYTGEYFYIGRTSPLGNPYVIGKDGNREEVIEKYRRYLWHSIQHLTRAGKYILELAACPDDDIVLGCHCKPLPCHGDVVRAAIQWLRAQP